MKKNNIILAISCFISVIAIIFAMLIDTVGAIISSLITTIITMLGAVLIWIQLKKTGIKVSNELINNMNTILLKSEGLVYLRDKLKVSDNPKDFSVEGKRGKTDTTGDMEKAIYDDSINIIEYLEFFENIGAMYFSGCVELKDLDECFGEMFFVAYNNKYIQNREIIPYKEHYVLSIRLYKEWYKFRQKHGIKSPYENNPLDYEKLLKEIK